MTSESWGDKEEQRVLLRLGAAAPQELTESKGAFLHHFGTCSQRKEFDFSGTTSSNPGNQQTDRAEEG